MNHDFFYQEQSKILASTNTLPLKNALYVSSQLGGSVCGVSAEG